MQPEGARESLNCICSAIKCTVIALCCVQNLFVFSASKINDETIRYFDPAFCGRHHRQLFICYDTFQTYMTLFHYVCAWRSTLRQIPLFSCFIVIQTDLT